MKLSVLRQILGRILMIEALFMIPPLIVGIIYREPSNNLLAFGVTIGLLLSTGLIMSRGQINQDFIGIKEGFAIVSLSWILLSFFGGLPFVFSGEIPSLVDAFFETSSGFTTTGASILVDVEAMSQSMLFWRSFTHLIGGMGILVFALAVLPKTGQGSVHIMAAEVPGPTFGKLVPKLHVTARILYKIYLGMTMVLILLLILCGMGPFDAMIHAFGAAGTGGFSNKIASAGHFNSAAVDYVLGIAMIVFGVNFDLYYLISIGRWREALESEELRSFLKIIGVACVLIMLLLAPKYSSFSRLLRDVFFTVSSIISTTGYATVDFDLWPLFTHYILLILMFIGSCAGSTAGGLKVSRVLILFKSGLGEVKRVLSPHRVMVVTKDKRPVKRETIQSAHMYLTLYIAVFGFSLLLVTLDAPDFMTAFSAVAATLNNIGPGLAAVGPTKSFAFFSDFSKVVLSFTMIIGRLEILPMLILFSPSTWTKR